MLPLEIGILLSILSAVECWWNPIKAFESALECPEGEVPIESVEAYVSKCEHVTAELLYCVGTTKDNCLTSEEFVTCQNTTEDCSIDNVQPEHENTTLKIVTPRFCWPSEKRGCVQKGGCVFTYRLEDDSDIRWRNIMYWFMVIAGIALVYTCISD